MSETKHTLGPWISDGTEVGTRWLLDIKVAKVDGTSHENRIANAILIAAAPDMLAALEACEEELRAETPRMSFIVIRMRAAIAAATGGALIKG